MVNDRHPGAPKLGTVVGRLDEFPDGQCQERVFGKSEAKEAFRLVIFRQGNTVRGFVNRCPHFQLPLSNAGRFMMWDEQSVMCTYHSAVFRLTDGYCTDRPCLGTGLAWARIWTLFRWP